MKKPYTQSGKCGDTVWQRARSGLISYPYHRPADPRTVAQVGVRREFGVVSSAWRLLTEEQRQLWGAAALTERTRRRLGRDSPMTGFHYFVRVNMARRHQGLGLAEVPPW